MTLGYGTLACLVLQRLRGIYPQKTAAPVSGTVPLLLSMPFCLSPFAKLSLCSCFLNTSYFWFLAYIRVGFCTKRLKILFSLSVSDCFVIFLFLYSNKAQVLSRFPFEKQNYCRNKLLDFSFRLSISVIILMYTLFQRNRKGLGLRIF